MELQELIAKLEELKEQYGEHVKVFHVSESYDDDITEVKHYPKTSYTEEYIFIS